MDIETSVSAQGEAVASPVTRTREEFEELLGGLRKLDRSLGPAVNKHDRVIVLVHACLDQGANTRAQIMALLKPLGFDRRHIAIVLKAETGNDPTRHRWQQHSDKTFTNFPDGTI